MKKLFSVLLVVMTVSVLCNPVSTIDSNVGFTTHDQAHHS